MGEPPREAAVRPPLDPGELGLQRAWYEQFDRLAQVEQARGVEHVEVAPQYL